MKKLKLLPDSNPLQDEGVVYPVSQSVLHSYASACLDVAGIVTDSQPDAIFCPLRGAYPPTRVVLELLGDSYQGEVEWVPASRFLGRREDLVQAAAMNYGRTRSVSDGPGHILSINTATESDSGSSLHQILENAIFETMNNLIPPEGSTLDYTRVNIWQIIKEGCRKVSPQVRSKYGYNVRFTDFNIGVENLVCEDNPNLLGINYQHEGSPYVAQVMAKNPIVVQGDKTQEHKPEEGETTADLFVRLVFEEARKIKAAANK